MNSRKNEGGQFVNDLLRTEFHKYAHFQSVPRVETHAMLQEIYDKVHQGMRYHPGAPLAHSHRITSVINAFCSPIRVMCICFHSSHSAICRINPCSTSILPQPNPACPFRKIRGLWYTSMHAKRCTVSLVLGLDEAGGSIPGNTDIHFRPGEVRFRLFLQWPQGRLLLQQPPRSLIVALPAS